MPLRGLPLAGLDLLAAFLVRGAALLSLAWRTILCGFDASLIGMEINFWLDTMYS